MTQAAADGRCYTAARSSMQSIRRGLYSLLAFALVSFLLLASHLYTTFPASLSPLAFSSAPACFIPHFDPFDPVTRPFVKTLTPYHCGGQAWLTRVERGVLSVEESVLRDRGERLVNCSYRVIERQTDEDVSYTAPVTFTRDVTIPQPGFLTAECWTQALSGKEKQYKDYHHVMLKKKELEDTLDQRLSQRSSPNHHVPGSQPQQKQNWMNVIFIGVDSMSRFSTLRLMPRLRHFLLERMHAVELTNYNKVGDNTFPNVLGLLTGRKVDEDTTDMLSHIGVINKAAMDRQGLRFLWDDFEEQGHRTLYSEDSPGVGTFNWNKGSGFVAPPTQYHYRPLEEQGHRTLYIEDSPGVGTFNWNKGSGFVAPPTHYYYRPLEVAKWRHSGLFAQRDRCFAGWPSDQVMLNYTLDFCRLFHDKPQFLLTYLTTSTHGDINGGSAVDGYHETFLSSLEADGLLDNTLLVYFSDHGVRGLRSAQGFRKTPMGKFEEMRPFLFLAFPPWFRRDHPDLLARVQGNADRLTTHFDVHSTVLDVLYLGMEDPHKSERKTIHGISLFDEIPPTRTCLEAGIPVPYCVCLRDSPLSTTTALAREAGRALMTAVNALQSKVADQCHTLTVHSVTSFARVDGGGKLLDLICDGFFVDKALYRVTLTASPGGALFEGTLSRCSGNAPFVTQGEVNRLNWYGNTSHCVSYDRLLKKVCYCKSNPP